MEINEKIKSDILKEVQKTYPKLDPIIISRCVDSTIDGMKISAGTLSDTYIELIYNFVLAQIDDIIPASTWYNFFAVWLLKRSIYFIVKLIVTKVLSDPST